MPPKKSKSPAFNAKDLVLAKMHGFPAWPSFVMPHNLIPEAILQVKKKTTEFCVIFIPDGDFYWLPEKSLEYLTEDKLEAKINKIPKNYKKPKTKGKSTSINDAFLATKGLEFEAFMKRLKRENGEEDDDEDDDVPEEDEEEEIGQAKKVGKIQVDEEEDLESRQDEEEEEVLTKIDDTVEEPEVKAEFVNDILETNGGRSTRLKSNGTEDEIKVEVKSNGIDKQSDDEVITRKRNGNEKFNSTAKKYKTESPVPMTTNHQPKHYSEEEKLQQLWLCRIKLQKSLIQRDSTNEPNADELSTSRLVLRKLAEFDVNLELLKTTKIHKVLKCIIKDKNLEYPESFKLHDKCQELLNKWSNLIEEIKLEKTAKFLNSREKINESNDIKDGKEMKFASVES